MEYSLLNERGIEVFNTCKAFLEANDLWEGIDVFLLESYAFNVEQAEKLAREINKEGLTIKYTNKGGFTNDVINPKVAIYRDFSSLASKTAASFGFTPLARKKLKLPDGKNYRNNLLDGLD